MQVHQENMEKVKLYLSLGSNKGDRRLNIEYAVSMLNIEFKKSYSAISSLIETEPWGFESDDMFLNAVVLYELPFAKGYNPEAEGLLILEKCKEIERKIGRIDKPQFDDKGKRIYVSRPIDIDILLFGNNRIDCNELTVPHPHMWNREFVMKPLLEIASEKMINNYKI